ncbi:hypothetical protein E1180_20120 [Roseibium denhamense]|uniref:Solute-binding protein family 3/N-terminal domain-containing protein n=1 Tax=Roseibium denhamense TaxID=76305 RepID=A0ABY1PEI7_9HYPH|nr:hypothetical protein [Roseibium denhamense]MTI07814.1 hypothetical protein [Roseibium denhamense]SMP32073.1 hypothetical protein SAMN06265374_3455 [Roseibium denhamense]
MNLTRSHRCFAAPACVLGVFVAAPAAAHEPLPACPQEISYIEKLPSAESVLDLLRDLYTEIGCDTRFTAYPGRRSVLMFNAGKIDGQFARLPIIEADYRRAFLRSALPVNEARAILWQRPDAKVQEKKPLGYTIGVRWQDAYVTHEDAARGFYAAFEKMQAYENGVIDRFIETDQNVALLVAAGVLKRRPDPVTVIKDFQAFHFVGAEFSDFMERFDAAHAVSRKQHPERTLSKSRAGPENR